ncbi:transposase [Streptomyces atratus]|uniref:transposase n=1 Tax=Streptomyces atratus TaxID=1893 RepID=UPI000D1B4C76|nr:transposase [Streptomyces atratus]
MIGVEDWAEIRRLHRAEGMSNKGIARHLGIARRTVRRAVASDDPPKYRRAPKGSIVDAIVLVWENLNVHKAEGLRKFAATRDWLAIYYLPPYAPDLSPVEGTWSLLRRGWLSNVAFTTPEHLMQRIRSGLRHIQYRSNLIDGCLTETGLTVNP